MKVSELQKQTPRTLAIKVHQRELRIEYLEKRIAELSKNVDELEEELLKTPQIKELSDEEINAVYHEVWNSNKWSDVEGIDIEKFARAILKKASEK